MVERGYIRRDEIQACKDMGIEALVPKTHTFGNKVEGLFDNENFKYVVDIVQEVFFADLLTFAGKPERQVSYRRAYFSRIFGNYDRGRTTRRGAGGTLANA